MDQQHEEDRDILIGALDLARERVTADTIAVKEERRQRLKDAISRMYLDEGRPSADELRELLGDPDDKVIRRCLAEWEPA